MKEEAIAALMTWAIQLSGYALPERLPDIEFVPHSFFVEHYCEGQEPCRITGWYPGIIGTMHANGVVPDTIYLDYELAQDNDIMASSIIVHELVHYLQDKAGAFNSADTCMQHLNEEREAYEVQRKYLQKFNIYHAVGLYLTFQRCEDG